MFLGEDVIIEVTTTTTNEAISILLKWSVIPRCSTSIKVVFIKLALNLLHTSFKYVVWVEGLGQRQKNNVKQKKFTCHGLGLSLHFYVFYFSYAKLVTQYNKLNIYNFVGLCQHNTISYGLSEPLGLVWLYIITNLMLLILYYN